MAKNNAKGRIKAKLPICVESLESENKVVRAKENKSKANPNKVHAKKN